MNPRLIWTLGTGGVLLAGGIGLAMVMAEPTKGPVFIAGDKPVTEDQVRQKLQSDGWSDVQIARDGRYLEATGSKDGKPARWKWIRRPVGSAPITTMMTMMTNKPVARRSAAKLALS